MVSDTEKLKKVKKIDIYLLQKNCPRWFSIKKKEKKKKEKNQYGSYSFHEYVCDYKSVQTDASGMALVWSDTPQYTHFVQWSAGCLNMQECLTMRHLCPHSYTDLK